jgi:acyl carrier protein
MVTTEHVCELIRKKLGSGSDAELNEATALRDVGLSSLQIADIVYTIEDEMEIEFDPSKAADVVTVGDLVELARQTALAGAS